MNCNNVNILVVIYSIVLQDVSFEGNWVHGDLPVLFLATACEATLILIKVQFK